MELRRSHEGPEVVPAPVAQEQYPHYQQGSPYPYPSPNGAPPPQYNYGPEKGTEAQYFPTANGAGAQRKSRRKWWIIGIVLLIVIAAAVGGAVGGVLGKKKSGSHSEYDTCLAIQVGDVKDLI